MNNKNISENYQKSENNNHVRIYINRPDVDYKKAIFTILIAVSIIACISIVLACALRSFFKVNILIVAIIFFVSLLTLTIFCFLKKILVWLVKVYQNRAKFETRLRCCYEPSCSEYAILAIEKYGAIKGVIKTIKRLKRCHPPGGVDYP